MPDPHTPPVSPPEDQSSAAVTSSLAGDGLLSVAKINAKTTMLLENYIQVLRQPSDLGFANIRSQAEEIFFDWQEVLK